MLDDQLDCKRCGTISLEIPEGATEDTPIHCSSCRDYLGTWGGASGQLRRPGE